MLKHIQFLKADESEQTVAREMTSATVDKSGERFDYDGGGKAAVQYWSGDFERRTRAAGQEISLGNIRLEHNAQIAGKATRIDYDDSRKRIYLIAKLTADIWQMAKEGLVTGFSIAGSYDSRNCDECGADMMGGSNYCPKCQKRVVVKFVPRIAECSVVDNPCVPSATFEYVRSDGTSEMRKFAKQEQDMNRSHFKALADFHKSSAGHHKEKSERSERIAKCFKAMGVPALEKEFNDDARDEQSRMKAHDEAHARWDRMNAEVGHDDETREQDKHPIRDGKVAKGDDAVDEFFRQFYAPPTITRNGPRDVAKLFE